MGTYKPCTTCTLASTRRSCTGLGPSDATRAVPVARVRSRARSRSRRLAMALGHRQCLMRSFAMLWERPVHTDMHGTVHTGHGYT